jgi:lycopene cyclase-like protein
MDRLVFLLMALALLAVWLGLWVARADLRSAMLKVSLVGGGAGLVAELWYFRDYWRPPTLAGVARPSPEDALFGFAVTGVAFAAHKVVFHRAMVPGAPRRYPIAAGLGVLGLAALVAGTAGLRMNSIFVTSAAFVACAAAMVALRRDLLRPAAESAALVVGAMLPVYLLLFDVLSPAYWDRYWLLRHTPWGVLILGNIPVTEILWYASWGALAGIAYEFTTGRLLQPLASQEWAPTARTRRR